MPDGTIVNPMLAFKDVYFTESEPGRDSARRDPKLISWRTRIRGAERYPLIRA